jgi:hypothetical protein
VSPAVQPLSRPISLPTSVKGYLFLWDLARCDQWLHVAFRLHVAFILVTGDGRVIDDYLKNI